MIERDGADEDGHVCRCMEVSEKLDPTTETHSAHPIPHVHDESAPGFHEVSKWVAANLGQALQEKYPNGCPSCWMNPTDHDYEKCPEYAHD